MSEIWKDIPGYEGLYQASSEGRIRTAEGKITKSARFEKRVWKQRILKPKACADPNKCGYRLTLWKNGSFNDYLVARLVCTTFHENLIGTSLTVNHKDGNRLNNNANNLEWLSLGDNIRDGFNTGLYRTQHPVKLVNTRTGAEYCFRSKSEASRYLKRSLGYISDRREIAISSSGEEYSIVNTKGA